MIFVLVHGAFQGGWCWTRLRKSLVDAGHQVFAPSLAGLGERSFLLSSKIGLETHICEIADLLRFEDLRDVVLVGHSYGGMVVTGACDLAGDRIRDLVYLDALVPQDGQSNLDIMDEPVADLFRQAATDGWQIEVPADVLLPYLGIESAEDRAWFQERLRPQSLYTFEQPYRASTSAVEPVSKTFIQSTNPSSGPAYAKAAEHAHKNGWACYSLPTAHESMWTMAPQLADILLNIAGSDSSPRPAGLRGTWTS